jgi:hypothetical protein
MVPSLCDAVLVQLEILTETSSSASFRLEFTYVLAYESRRDTELDCVLPEPRTMVCVVVGEEDGVVLSENGESRMRSRRNEINRK